MDYNNKKKFKKKKKKQKLRDLSVKAKREATQKKHRQEKKEATLVYKLRERLTPFRKLKND